MPITIGTFDNVPAPGDPIRSPWTQEISQYVTDGSRLKGFANGPTGDVGPYNQAPQDISGMVVNYAQVTGHVYSVRATITVQALNAGIVALAIGDGAQAVTRQVGHSCAVNDVRPITVEDVYQAGSTGNVTRRAMLSINTGGVNYIASFNRTGIIVVYDMGTAGR